ncbi:MAG: hypothetical protein ACLPI9_08155 [Halobacteriota archaeon]
MILEGYVYATILSLATMTFFGATTRHTNRNNEMGAQVQIFTMDNDVNAQFLQDRGAYDYVRSGSLQTRIWHFQRP